MIKSILTILLIITLSVGMIFWMEDHDNTRLRVIRLGSVISLALILLTVLYLFDG